MPDIALMWFSRPSASSISVGACHMVTTRFGADLNVSVRPQFSTETGYPELAAVVVPGEADPPAGDAGTTVVDEHAASAVMRAAATAATAAVRFLVMGSCSASGQGCVDNGLVLQAVVPAHCPGTPDH